MTERKKARLLLQNGSCFDGYSFGYDGASAGEIVFSTAMVGYPESLTDPSYSGQILCVTYPMVGNYGVPKEEWDEYGIRTTFESGRMQARGLVISDYSQTYSHYDAQKSLEEWLREEKVPGICGVDTRALTQLIRESGAMLGKIVPEGTEEPGWYDPDTENQVAMASCTEPRVYGKGDKTVVLVDCGVKHRILHCLASRGVKVVRVPWNYDFNTMEWDGLMISNGPGNPSLCIETVEHIRQAYNGDKPIFGICMGNQLMSLAAGAKTYKLKYGHRGHNQPVRLCGSDKCYITSQNHGFAVDTQTLDKDWEPHFTNLNDGTNEGIRHRSKNFFSVQFHPEASSGPLDTEFLFDRFIELL